MPSHRIKFVAPLALAVAGLGVAHQVTAAGAEVTTGSVNPLPGAVTVGVEPAGHVHMVRLPADGGRTRVVVNVTGLAANTTYPVHVHNAPCSGTPAGGGHYQHTVGGAVDAVNEIWPTVTTNDDGVGHGIATHEQFARPDAQSLIIHYPQNTSIRLACADLG
ncbi:MAG TPA: hypothetical protein VGK49_12955 [Ilumatobacteraceae bacterium]